MAPMTMVPLSSRMPDKPGILPMSMSAFGWARRRFMMGSRLWPPARIFASPPYCVSSERASWIVVGAWYSNEVAGIASPPYLGSLYGVPNPLGFERHIKMFHTQRSQRIHDGIDDGGAGRDRAGLANAFNAKGVDWRWRLGAIQLEVHKIVGLGHRVVHHRAADKLSILVIDGLFIERLG